MIRVAGYCRVSTDKNDQSNSFENQQRYFREYIDRNSDWDLYEIYADEGITGTSTKKRTQFNRMISDAYKGEFNLIITKEVSRFSRNILDTISYTRQLKSIGVAVLFMTDCINTMDPDAELRLSIMASIAQEESRRTSSRVTWGQTRQMEKGVVFGRSLLGYDVINGKISINPAGSIIVEMIFRKYALEQIGTSEIARFLKKEGYCTYSGNTNWKSTTIIKILKNEKYVGDLIQKKSYTPDYLSHKKQKNKGEVPLIYIKNHHEPIISRTVWNLTQERLKQNNKHTNKNIGPSSHYIFSGRMKCNECGSNFISRYKYQKDGTRIRRWSCRTAVCEGASVCGISRLVRDDEAIHILKTAIQNLSIDSKYILTNLTTLVLEAFQSEPLQKTEQPERLCSEIELTFKKKEAVLESYFSGVINKSDMQIMKEKYERQIDDLKNKIQSAGINKEKQVLKQEIQFNLKALLNCEVESEALYKMLLNRIIVFKDRHMELHLNHLPQIFIFTE